MNIREVKVIGKDSIVIVTTENHVYTYNRKKLNNYQRTMFDNILSCSLSLISETPTK